MNLCAWYFHLHHSLCWSIKSGAAPNDATESTNSKQLCLYTEKQINHTAQPDFNATFYYYESKSAHNINDYIITISTLS